MGRLTTHVLDTALGRPAAGIPIRLYRVTDAGREPVADAVTNEDGRCDAPVLEGEAFVAGEYEIVFHAGDYLSRAAGGEAGAHDPRRPPFLATIPIRFGVGAAEEHYHVPLLLSPFGYSTYRGS